MWHSTERACFAAAKSSGHKFFVKSQQLRDDHKTDVHKFASFPTAGEFYQYYKSYNNKRRFHEMNTSCRFGDTHSKLYLDIEWEAPTREADCLTKVGEVLTSIIAILD